MAARVTGPRRKISAARIALRCRPRPELARPVRRGADRSSTCCTQRGHTAASRDRPGSARPRGPGRCAGPDGAPADCRQREAGSVALLLLNDSRGPAGGTPRRLAMCWPTRDRSMWDRAAIARRASGAGDQRDARRPGPASSPSRPRSPRLHAQAPSYGETDWPECWPLYDELMKDWPSPVVALQTGPWCDAMIEGPEAGLTERSPGWRRPNGRAAGGLTVPVLGQG